KSSGRADETNSQDEPQTRSIAAQDAARTNLRDLNRGNPREGRSTSCRLLPSGPLPIHGQNRCRNLIATKANAVPTTTSRNPWISSRGKTLPPTKMTNATATAKPNCSKRLRIARAVPELESEKLLNWIYAQRTRPVLSEPDIAHRAEPCSQTISD